VNNEYYYKVKGFTEIEVGNDVSMTEAELLVKAISIEEACEKARQFLSPVVKFIPTECEWKK